MKYLKLFENPEEVGSGYTAETPIVSYLDGSNILLISEKWGEEVDITYNESKDEIEFDPNVKALKFIARENNSTIGLAKLSTGQTLEYSTDFGITWDTMTTETTINLSSGKTVYIKGILSSNNTSSNYTKFTMSGNLKVSGNINYLWNKDNPDAALKQYCGAFLFYNCTGLTDASELKLPALYLSTNCYYNMFSGCTSLTTTPELPATKLANQCYQSMFYGCTSLTTAPELPATTLANWCYYGMFNSCTSLTTAPELPATTLATYCYYYMFSGCTNLNYIKCLATNISASNCTSNWVSNVAATGTFVKNPSMTSWTTGVNGIPSNWRVEDAS